MQEILRRVHESDDGGAAMAEALSMGASGAHSVDAGRDGGSASGSDEDEVRLHWVSAVAGIRDLRHASYVQMCRGGNQLMSLRGTQVDDAVPLSAATLQRLLAAAQGDGSSDGAGLDSALQQLNPGELREFERFVASGQVCVELPAAGARSWHALCSDAATVAVALANSCAHLFTDDTATSAAYIDYSRHTVRRRVLVLCRQVS